MKINQLLLALLVACTAGCADGPMSPIIESRVQGDSQFYVHAQTDMPAVTEIAMDYCAGRGKNAVVQYQTPYGDPEDGLVQTNYVCK